MLDRPDQEVILVVDDQPDNLMLMSELLMGQYQVRVAGSGVHVDTVRTYPYRRAGAALAAAASVVGTLLLRRIFR